MSCCGEHKIHEDKSYFENREFQDERKKPSWQTILGILILIILFILGFGGLIIH